MSVDLGAPRSAIPPSNVGQQNVAQRRVAQAVARAAVKTSNAVAVDAHLCRLWVKNPRGTVPCPCSSEALSRGSAYGPGSSRVLIEPGEGDDLRAPDSSYPQGRAEADNEQLPSEPDRGESYPDYIDDVARLLLGNGKRCGICWGTGWVDGHRLWGGERLVLCAADTVGVTVDPDSTAELDLSASTPTMVSSPGSVSPSWVRWTLELPVNLTMVDALRVRSGLGPAEGNWSLSAVTPAYPGGADAALALGLAQGVPAPSLTPATTPTSITLTLGPGARVSHVELVLRSERLVNLQLPQLQAVASAELIAPYMVEEFELDPVVGYIERGSILEVPPRGDGLGSVWLVSDVTVKRSAQGGVFGVIGTARSVQPTEVLACASLDESLAVGVLDPGHAHRGLEATESGQPSGVGGVTDDSVAAVLRGSQQRLGGGVAPASRAVIILSSGTE